MQTIQKHLSGNRLSDHVQKRARQRGFRDQDLELIMNYGETVRDGIAVTDNTLRRLRSQLQQLRGELQRLERLRGTAVIVQDGTVVTAYRTSKSKLRCLRAG